MRGNIKNFICKIAVVSLFAGTLAGCSTNPSSIKALDYIELGEYKGLNVERLNTEVSEEDIQSEIDTVLASLAEKKVVTNRDTVKKGDTANIDYVGKKDGVAFDGGTASDCDLEIGSGQFIPGFEDGLIGVKVGETKVLDLTFPENYGNTDLAGAEVQFEVKVNAIKESVLPELTDSFIYKQTGGEYTTVEKYREGIRKDLEQEKKEYADTKMYSDLVNQVVASSTVKKDIPDEYLQNKVDIMKNNVKTYADSYGVDYATFIQTYMGKTAAEFSKECEEFAVTASKETLVVLAIAEKEGLNLTKDELNEAISEYTKIYGYESEEMFKEKTDMNQFNEYVLTSKVQEFLADNAVITVSDEKAW